MMRDSVGPNAKIDLPIDATRVRYPEEASTAVTLQIMLAQQVFAVIIAVGRANHRVDVLTLGWLLRR
jgi:hypothetical protein